MSITNQDDPSRLAPSQASYAGLEEALAAREWLAADWLTRFLMCRIADRLAGPFLTPEAIEAFPCADLERIDRLWGDASGGCYGFSPQRRVWIEQNGPPRLYRWHEMTRENRLCLGCCEQRFAEAVGWAEGKEYRGYRAGDALRPGGLPYAVHMCSYGRGLTGLVMTAICARLGVCQG